MTQAVTLFRDDGGRHEPLGVTVPLFRGVPTGPLTEILADCPILSFLDQETLLSVGQVNEKLYIVLEGRLTVHLGRPESPLLIPIEVGNCVGEMSIADHTPVSAKVVAEPGCRVLAIDGEVVWNRLALLQGFSRNLLVNQAERLRHTNQELVNKMRRELEYQQLERDLAVANEIQLSMLPRHFPLYPERTEFDVFATMVAAQEVAGDFYYIFLIDHDHLFFVIGDVSGKGVSAALLMAKVITLFRALASPGLPINEILRRVNAQLCRDNDACMFVTVLCCILETSTGIVEFANGGHGEPLVGMDREFEFLPLPLGRLLGLDDQLDFDVGRVTLMPGQMMLLYTDGVTEAYSQTHEMFSEERLRGGLNRIGSEDVTNTVLGLNILVSTHANGAPQSDDITLLAVKFTPTGFV
ncbi:MAG: PP2C family protein-serine/threonine phosphatase [Alphaproteobacteria bacterium]